MIVNVVICIFARWRVFANKYLHWTALFTWILINLQGFLDTGIGFTHRENLVWFVLFIIFVPYAMLPLPLKWCVAAGMFSTLSHLILTSLTIITIANHDVSM